MQAMPLPKGSAGAFAAKAAAEAAAKAAAEAAWWHQLVQQVPRSPPLSEADEDRVRGMVNKFVATHLLLRRTQPENQSPGS
jgi:hypothetical protein